MREIFGLYPHGNFLK